jgi:hypothetical protein
LLIRQKLFNNGWSCRPEIVIFIKPLLHYRLRWYAAATARLLLRRWQGLVLAVGLLASADAGVFENIAILNRPLLGLLAPGHGFAWRFGYLLVLQLVAVLWAVMQRAQIEGGGFMAFVGSLPFTPRQRRQVDLAVLVLADSPLLLMVAGSITVTAAHRHAAPHVVLLIDVALLALVAQLAALERRPVGWAGVLLACLLLADGVGAGLALWVNALVGAVAWLALRRAPWPAWPLAGQSRRLPFADRPRRLLRMLAARHAAALQVSLAILLRERRGEAIAKLMSAAAVFAGAFALMRVFDYDDRARIVALLAQGLTALTLSGMYRGLHMAHLASAGYTAALPIKPAWWRAFDLATVLGFGLPLLAVPAFAACVLAGLPPVRALAGIASNLALLAALRAPQLFRERHAVVLSTLVAGCWTVATIVYLN